MNEHYSEVWPKSKTMTLSYQILSAILIIFISIDSIKCVQNDPNEMKKPSILVAILVRNKQHTLPYFLTQFEQLSYPKQRLSLFIRSDHNQDQSIPILEQWLLHNKNYYHSINSFLDDRGPNKYHDEKLPTDWTDSRFDKVIALKEEALFEAHKIWADYIWFLDADVLITQPDLINIMIQKNKPLIAPMLNSLGTYSNYWGGMSEDYWYVRTEEYIPILERKNKGCFEVPMIHSCVFVDLNRKLSEKLSFDPENVTGYAGPTDDIITFAISSKELGLEMTICNEEIYGYIPPPLNDDDELSKDFLQMTSIKLEIIINFSPLKVSPSIKAFEPPRLKKDKLGFDEVYLINLLRRSERRKKMYHSFDELGLEVKFFEAVDGSKLNESYLADLGIKQLSDYKDPWAKRDMTYGEIGCFLSHYKIWQDVIEKKYQHVSAINAFMYQFNFTNDERLHAAFLI